VLRWPDLSRAVGEQARRQYRQERPTVSTRTPKLARERQARPEVGRAALAVMTERSGTVDQMCEGSPLVGAGAGEGGFGTRRPWRASGWARSIERMRLIAEGEGGMEAETCSRGHRILAWHSWG